MAVEHFGQAGLADHGQSVTIGRHCQRRRHLILFQSDRVRLPQSRAFEDPNYIARTGQREMLVVPRQRDVSNRSTVRVLDRSRWPDEIFLSGGPKVGVNGQAVRPSRVPSNQSAQVWRESEDQEPVHRIANHATSPPLVPNYSTGAPSHDQIGVFRSEAQGAARLSEPGPTYG